MSGHCWASNVTGENRIGLQLMWKAAREVNYPGSFPGKRLMQGVICLSVVDRCFRIGSFCTANDHLSSNSEDTAPTLSLTTSKADKIDKVERDAGYPELLLKQAFETTDDQLGAG